jgi:hypothetical protein
MFFLGWAMHMLFPHRLGAAERDIELIPGTSTADRMTKASAGSMESPILLREIHINIPLPEGRSFPGDLLIAYDTVSYHYWWLLWGDGGWLPGGTTADWFASHAAMVVVENKIVVFWSVRVLSRLERVGLSATGIEDAQRQVLDLIRRRASEYVHPDAFLPDTKSIDLPRLFPWNFWFPPGIPVRPIGHTQILSAHKEGANWRLVMRDQWDQELILDESYAFVSTRRLDTVPPAQK